MSSTAEKRHANSFSDWPIALTCKVHELYCIFSNSCRIALHGSHILRMMQFV